MRCLNNIFSRILVVSSLCFTFMFLPLSAIAENAAHNPEKIFVQLGHSTDDLHAAFMALKIAEALQKRGAEVTLFLNLEAVSIADKRKPNNILYGFSDSHSLAYLYDKFISEGGKVLVCPMCAKLAGLDEKDLRGGAKFATSTDEIAQVFLESDKSLSY